MNQNYLSMFREYDIRGRVNDDELNVDSVYDIMRAYGTYLRRRNIKDAVLGYDNRKCSPSFARSSIRALRDSGIDVKYIGLAISPFMYYAQYYFNSLGGVMITASHNPDGWSGFKLAKGLSKTLENEDIREILSIISSKGYYVPGVIGELEEVNIREDYIRAIVDRIQVNKDNIPRVVLDAGNGGAGLFAYEVFHRLGCTTFQLNCDPDDSYPHYFPNPSNLSAQKRLRDMVIHPYIKADVGFGFDGDGDRIGVLDENGDNVWSDRVLLILARQLLEKKPGATIVYDVKSTRALEEEIVDRGGTPIMWKTGHSHIKAKLHNERADLAGERSGHIFIGGDTYFGYDDAIFVAAKLVEYISYQSCRVSDILSSFPQYITSPEIKAHCRDDIKYSIVDSLVDDFKSVYGDRVVDINGARVEFDDGWGLVRASSNLPELVIIFEAKEESRLLEIREIFKNVLGEYPEISKSWDNDIYS